ncbi:MAG TPA: hypothetical protein VF510_07480 [Ktedonobacterales bacterium]
MRAVHIISLIARLALMAALLLGLLHWIFHISFINIHMGLGITGAVGLLTLGVVAVFTRGMRWLGVGSIVYAVILPVFGMTQSRILPGNLHWLIQMAHLAVGIGAMMVALRVERIYRRRDKATASAAESTATAIQGAR